MSPIPSNPRGMYFEEFQPGQVIASAGRTVTEADIVNFAGLSGDYTQIHTDAEYSKKSLAGQRIAHGLLVLAIASGLAAQTGVLEGTVIVFREINEWKFIKPVFIGDEVRADLNIIATKALPRPASIVRPRKEIPSSSRMPESILFQVRPPSIVMKNKNHSSNKFQCCFKYSVTINTIMMEYLQRCAMYRIFVRNTQNTNRNRINLRYDFGYRTA